MRVRRIGYVAVRTDDVDAMTSFFREVIGLEEMYTQEHRDARLIPDDADVVIGFVVEDI